jgi:hypothetical protein
MFDWFLMVRQNYTAVFFSKRTSNIHFSLTLQPDVGRMCEREQRGKGLQG